MKIIENLNENSKEIWRDVVGYEGLYQVSNLGRVKSLGRNIKKPLTKIGYVWQSERILKGRKDTKGYLRVVLYKDQTPKGFKVHRLVAVAFIPNPENKPEVDHINRNVSDNNVKNLQTKGEKAHGFNRGMIAPKMCVYNLNKHLQIYYNVRYEERIQTHKNDCILN